MNEVTFVRIPKSASSSVYAALGRANTIRDERLIPFFLQNKKRYRNLFAPSHCLLSEAVEILGFEIMEGPSFAVVRNPYARLGSMYRFSRNMGMGKIYGEDPSCLESFAESVMALLKSDVQFFHAYSQRSFLTLEGEVAVTGVLKFENLQEDFDDFMDLHGLNQLIGDLPKDNVTLTSKQQDPSAPCSPTTKAIVQEMWQEDFEEFGYLP